MRNSAVLLIDCPDRKGLVAGVANLLYRYGANITHADQHQDPEAELFFMRVEWDLAAFDLLSFREEFETLAAALQMRWRLNLMSQPPRVAIFVSKQLRLLAASGIDLVVLARYMQILPPAFVEQYPSRIINVHHSFLPAFVGARPYHAAFHRGVKLIGATSHYVTAVLDDGPIIEQDVVRISHREQVEDLVRKGRDLERVVLSRAVAWHLEHRILCYGNKTVIFD